MENQNSKRIDITQEFLGLYESENMLAYFRFTMPVSPDGSTSGLCRISKPRSKGETSRSVSLNFVVDTPGGAATPEVNRSLDKLDGSGLSKVLPEVSMAFSAPVSVSTSESCVRQVDIFLDSAIDLNEPFLRQKLLPAIEKCVGLVAAEVEWWK